MNQEKINEVIQKLNDVYKLLDIEETNIIADYNMEYGNNSDYWDEEIAQKFDEDLTPVQDAMSKIWDVLNKFKKGEFNRGN